ncbi:MAG: SDR family NAD(P)-dependent oxidoreductase [Dehalococcoidia bacterium]
MAVNVKGMVPARGSIVNISSIAYARPHALTPYAASKGAVVSLTWAMAGDHARDGIRVNCVAPGPVYTPMVYAAGMPEEMRERRKNSSLLKVEGTGWDIGNAVLFLASDEARYITGVVLPVDGGVMLASPNRR